MAGLLERIRAMTDTRVCGAPGCKRAPAYPDQRYCPEHRIPWRRNLVAREDGSWRVAA